MSLITCFARRPGHTHVGRGVARLDEWTTDWGFPEESTLLILQMRNRVGIGGPEFIVLSLTVLRLDLLFHFCVRFLLSFVSTRSTVWTDIITLISLFASHPRFVFYLFIFIIDLLWSHVYHRHLPRAVMVYIITFYLPSDSTLAMELCKPCHDHDRVPRVRQSETT